MRRKLCITAILLVLLVITGAGAVRNGLQRQDLVFPDALEEVAVTVDGRALTLRELAFYIAYEEGQIEADAYIYNPEDTGEYWRIYTNHTFLRKEGKQTTMDMAIHDEIFYQLALAEGIELTEEEEMHLANDQYDFWSDLEEEQRAALGVSEDVLKDSMRKIALAEKYQYLLAETQNKDYEAYSFTGTEYADLLKEHDCKIEEAVWNRVNFGGITVDH